MSDFNTYDSNDIDAVLCGIPINGGYAEGTFIEVSQQSKDFTSKVGSRGDVTRSKTNDRRAFIRVTLMQKSASNGLLSALSNVDRNLPNGAGVGPSIIKDSNGTALYTAEKSWITGPPEVTFSGQDEARIWEIECAELIRFDGA